MMMQNCPMTGGGGMMMIGMGVIWLLTVVALVLAIAALVKYLRARPRTAGLAASHPHRC